MLLRCFCILLYSCNTKSFCELLKMMIIVPIYGTSTRFFKVSIYNLGYVCTLLEWPFYFELNSIIFNFVHSSNHKLWQYN